MGALCRTSSLKREIGRGRSPRAVTAEGNVSELCCSCQVVVALIEWSFAAYTHIAIAFAPWRVLLFSTFNVIQRVKNSKDRCEGYTRIFQTMKNYYCLRPRGCFDSQILEDEAEHNIEHGVILLNSWSRWLFVLFSQCRKYEITQGNIVFYAPWNQDQGRNDSRTSHNQTTTQNAKN